MRLFHFPIFVFLLQCRLYPVAPFTVGIQSILGPQYLPTFSSYITNSTGLPFQAVTYSNDSMMVVDARAGRLQYTFAGPVQYLCLALAATTSDGVAEIVSASFIDGNPVEKLAGAVVVKTGSPITSLQQLRNSTILAGPISSLTTFAAQWSLLKSAGVDMFTQTKGVFLGSNVTQILPNLLDGLGDAAFVPSSYIERFYPNTGNQFNVIGEVTHTGFPYRHSTPLYPNSVLSTLDTSSFTYRRAVAQALFNISPSDSFAQDADYYGFTPLGAYTQVRTLMASLGLLDNNTQCRTINDLYDIVQCPPGTVKLNNFTLQARCAALDVVCPPGYQCVCTPCQKVLKIMLYGGLRLGAFVGVLCASILAGLSVSFVTYRLLWVVTRPDPLDSLSLETATVVGKSSMGPIFATSWKGHPVAVKRLAAARGNNAKHNIWDADGPRQVCKHSIARHAFQWYTFLECLYIETPVTRNIARIKQQMQMQLHSSNIMPILGWSRGQQGTDLIIIMPRMMAGTIADLLASEGRLLDLQAIINIAWDVANGMSFCHCSTPPIIGKNTKPHHLFLADGFRTLIGTSWRSPNKSSVWSPPECLRGDSEWSMQADVYSYSMLLYTLVEGKQPFAEATDTDTVDVIRDADESTVADARPQLTTTSPINGLIEACWAQNPASRPSFEDVKNILKEIQASNPHPPPHLLQGMFPEHVRQLLESKQPVPTETFACVTIFFSDIKGFTSLASVMEPSAVKNMLDRLYTFMDNKAEEHDIHKLETIGDVRRRAPTPPLCIFSCSPPPSVCFLLDH